MDYGDLNIKQSIGNYKGLMLCSRPNEEIKLEVEKPFISRVDPKEQIGLNPVQKQQINIPMKRPNLILKRHLQWLQSYKQQVKDKKDQVEFQEIKRLNIINKLREVSLQRIQKVKMNSDQKLKEEEQTVSKEQKNNQNLKEDEVIEEPKEKKVQVKKEEPAPKKQDENFDDITETNDLLDFVKNLDYEQYIQDLEVKTMLNALKTKIDSLQQNENMNQMINEINKNEGQPQQSSQNSPQIVKKPVNQISKQDEQPQEQNDEVLSQRSKQSKQSIKSYREEFEKKTKKDDKQQADWDKSTVTNEKKITFEDKLVSHIANQILTSNKQIRGVHSNQSLRKLLEREAYKQLQQLKEKGNQNKQQKQL